MQDAVDAKENPLAMQGQESAKEEIEMVEPVKPNRHERRRRAKLARMQAVKDRLEEERRKK
jgi:hypothetical protein